MIDVSILIVSYNTSELTCAAIQSVYDQTKRVSFELIVVDNNSSDESADEIANRFPELNLIRLESNIGFAAANNLASEHAAGKYILLLNPDTVVLDSAVDKLVEFAEHNTQYGIYGGSTFFEDMSRNPTAGWNMATPWSLFSSAVGLSSLFRRSRFFNPESLEWWNWASPREVDIVTGCFLLIGHDLWDELDGFDERFHMYSEDVDLCIRAMAKGCKAILNPQACLIHYGGRSDHVRPDKLVRLLGAKVLLFCKHWKPIAAWYAEIMLVVLTFTRSIAAQIRYWIMNGDPPDASGWIAAFSRRNEWRRKRCE